MKAMQRALHGACLASCGRGHIQGRFRFCITAQCPLYPRGTRQNLAGIASAAQAHRVPVTVREEDSRTGCKMLAALDHLRPQDPSTHLVLVSALQTFEKVPCSK
ncbi:unnamed protein product [Symbiodinium sp. CCMP2592]|nr:unnamed protein product [Symbiodinium sp. CCMP2592]